MKIKEHKQRAWVRKHHKNLPQLHAQVLRRVLVLRDKLWSGHPKPFAYLLLGILGQMRPQNALGNAVVSCWELGLYEVCLLNYLNLMFAVSALSYFNRRHKAKPRVLVYMPPSEVPTDQMHLLDFSPAELGRQLDTALAAHGINQERALATLWAQGTTFPSGGERIPPADAHNAEVRKNNFLASILHMRSLGMISAEQAEKFKKISQRWFTAKAEVFGNSIARNYKQYRLLAIPDAAAVDAERLASLRAGMVIESCAPANALALNLMKFGRGDNSIVTLSALETLYPQELPTAQEKGSADMVYKRVAKAVARREYVQKVCSKKRTYAGALDECRIKYPELTLEQLELDRSAPGDNLGLAIEEAAERVGRGPAFAHKLYKRASANLGVNRIWGEYLQRFSSFPTPILK